MATMKITAILDVTLCSQLFLFKLSHKQLTAVHSLSKEVKR
jgi:hypothetical protein